MGKNKQRLLTGKRWSMSDPRELSWIQRMLSRTRLCGSEAIERWRPLTLNADARIL